MGKGIQLGDDGKYRWEESINLYTNPTILFLLWKIFGGIMFGMWCFMVLISMDSYNPQKSLVSITKGMGIGLGVMMVITLISYLIYALIMGGRYCAVFEMDEKGIQHIQIQYQWKKVKKIAKTVTLLGALSNNPGMAGSGMLAGSRQKMYSEFASVKKVIGNKKRGVIKVNGFLNHNQVYCYEDEYDFVYQFIMEHCQVRKGHEYS